MTMLRWVALLALTAALAPAAAGAATTADITSAFTSRPVDVGCPSQTEWTAMVAGAGQPAATSGLTWVTAGKARYAPWVCKAIADGPSNPQLGGALNIVVHEAVHLFGERDESVAACWGLVWAADLARRFYNVPFFSVASIKVMESARAVHASLSADYHRVCL